MTMKKKKKVNPRRKPVTQADINKAKDKATDEALQLVLYMVLYILVDKHDAPKEDIRQLQSELNYLADSINRGYVKWSDIRKVLEEEYDVRLELR